MTSQKILDAEQELLLDIRNAYSKFKLVVRKEFPVGTKVYFPLSAGFARGRRVEAEVCGYGSLARELLIQYRNKRTATIQVTSVTKCKEQEK